MGKIIPVYKKGNNKLIDNYRPIALLPTISRMFEAAIYSQLYEYIEHHHIINDSQYGFKKTLLLRYKKHCSHTSYFNNRRQYCDYKGTNFNMLLIHKCVPQGSILGPLLFILYVSVSQPALLGAIVLRGASSRAPREMT